MQPMEYYRDISIQISKVRYEISKLWDMLGGHTPKGIFIKNIYKSSKGIDQLNSDLEDRMFIEHPDEASTYMFYGDQNELWKQFVNADNAVEYCFSHPNWDYSDGEYDSLGTKKKRLREDQSTTLSLRKESSWAKDK